MTIALSTEGLQKNSISIGEVLLLLAIQNDISFEEAQKSLISKGFITAERGNIFKQNNWRITRKGGEILDSVAIDSEKSEKSEESLINLAIRLKEVFPPGRKDGTSNYWAEGKALIVKRLKAFFKKYGNNYSDDQIVEAAKKYVEGFNGRYQFMRTLKYFIFKEQDIAGERNSTSDLLNYLENVGQEETLSNDWDIELK